MQWSDFRLYNQQSWQSFRKPCLKDNRGNAMIKHEIWFKRLISFTSTTTIEITLHSLLLISLWWINNSIYFNWGVWYLLTLVRQSLFFFTFFLKIYSDLHCQWLIENLSKFEQILCLKRMVSKLPPLENEHSGNICFWYVNLKYFFIELI